MYLPAAQPAFVNLTNPNMIYVPKESVKYVQNYLHAAQELNQVQNVNMDENMKAKPFKLVGVKPGDRFNLNKKHFFKVFKCHHSIPCVGFGIYELKTRLNKEYLNLSRSEIGRLAKAGTVVNEVVEDPRFLHLGDTTTKVFEDESVIQFPIIIIECTFLLKEEESRSKSANHVHWNLLEPIVRKHQEITFILIHFSTKYSDEFILKYFNELPGGKPKNIVLWLGS